jgi:hypothetical protein
MGGPWSTPKMSEIRRLSFRFFSSHNLTSTLEPNWVTAVGCFARRYCDRGVEQRLASERGFRHSGLPVLVSARSAWACAAVLCSDGGRGNRQARPRASHARSP